MIFYDSFAGMYSSIAQEYYQEYCKGKEQLQLQINPVACADLKISNEENAKAIEAFRRIVSKQNLFQNLDSFMNLYYILQDDLKAISNDSMSLTSKTARELVDSIDTVFIDVINKAMEIEGNKSIQ